VLEKEEEDTGEMEMLCDDNDLTTVRALNFERNTTIRQANDQYRKRAYVCCDEDLTSIDIISTTANKNFLDEVDCIPVCSEGDVNDCIVNNKYGLLYPMTCENDVFRYPHILHTQSVTIESKGTRKYTLFECCKTPTSCDGGGGGDGPFIQDCVFNITVWPQIVNYRYIIIYTEETNKRNSSSSSSQPSDDNTPRTRRTRTIWTTTTTI
jgi:hypothetical protein